MQTLNSLKTLVDLGLADYETLAQNVIEMVPPDALMEFRGVLERAVNQRLESLRNSVRCRHCLDPNHWLLEHGDRKIIVRKLAGRTFRVYEAKFSKAGVLSKGRVTGTLQALAGMTTVKWEFLLGRI